MRGGSGRQSQTFPMSVVCLDCGHCILLKIATSGVSPRASIETAERRLRYRQWAEELRRIIPATRREAKRFISRADLNGWRGILDALGPVMLPLVLKISKLSDRHTRPVSDSNVSITSLVTIPEQLALTA